MLAFIKKKNLQKLFIKNMKRNNKTIKKNMKKSFFKVNFKSLWYLSFNIFELFVF